MYSIQLINYMSALPVAEACLSNPWATGVLLFRQLALHFSSFSFAYGRGAVGTSVGSKLKDYSTWQVLRLIMLIDEARLRTHFVQQ
jgi:hypothetical protein